MLRSLKTIVAGLVAATAGAAAISGVALADLNTGDVVGKSDAEITAELVNQGYEVKEIEREDGEIEAEVMKDGVAYEIEIDAETGQVAEIEEENDD